MTSTICPAFRLTLRVNNRRLSKTLHWGQQLLTPGLDRCGSNGIPQRR